MPPCEALNGAPCLLLLRLLPRKLVLAGSQRPRQHRALRESPGNILDPPAKRRHRPPRGTSPVTPDHPVATGPLSSGIGSVHQQGLWGTMPNPGVPARPGPFLGDAEFGGRRGDTLRPEAEFAVTPLPLLPSRTRDSEFQVGAERRCPHPQPREVHPGCTESAGAPDPAPAGPPCLP